MREQEGMVMPDLDGIEVVSFDLYDTLALRPFVRPTDLFRYIEQLSGIEGFHDVRIKAERDSRGAVGINGEVTLDEVYSLMPGSMAHLKDMEAELESELVFPNPPLVSIASSLGDRKVIVVTDMYLPRTVIETVLERIGVRPYRLYISNELRMSKHLGSMYDHVLEDLGITADRMLHIGDNTRSDIRIPRSKGIGTFHVQRPMDAYLGSDRTFRHFLKDDLTRSIILGIDLLIDKGVLSLPRDGWAGYGARVGGPLLYGYIEHIIPRIKGRPVFIARDGYSLQRVYKALTDCRDNETSYLNAQRLFNDVLFNSTLPEGPVDVPGRFGGWYMHNKLMNAIRGILSFHGIDASGDESSVVDAYNSNLDLIRQRREVLLEEYTAYMSGLCGDGDVSIIDCTTMKYTSKRLVERVLGRPVDSHFFVVLGDVQDDVDAYGVNNGLVLSWTKVDVPEFLMSSPESPVVGFRDGRVVNDPDPPEREAWRMGIYQDISDGEEAYARCIRSIFRHGLPHMGYDGVVSWAIASASVGSRYRDMLHEASWSSNTMHDDHHSLIFEPASMLHIVKKMADTVIIKLNHE